MNSNSENENEKKPSHWGRNIGLYLILFLILLCMVYLINGRSGEPATPYSDVVDLFQQENVESFTVNGNILSMQLYNDYNGEKTAAARLYSVELFRDDLGELITNEYNRGIIKSYDYAPAASAPWWAMFMPYILIFVVLGVMWYFMMSRTIGGAAAANDKTEKFGRARTHMGVSGGKKVTFDDVAGADEEKEELQEIVAFLRDPDKYTALGARIPKGVLLVGPPGTGKTLLAKAVAGEADVQFLSISGSDFVELYVGVGASRVRDLFEQAKKSAPAIVFIDEIDAVGRQRGTGLGGGHDEREQTLNQLLVEMDGFGSNEGVVVMAATNRADVLDPALLRPGRFDRQVFVGLPDIKGREDILKVHTRNKPLADDVDLHVIAQSTAGFAGADLENLSNEGALLAARKNERVITMDDLREAMIKVIAGPEKKSHVIPEHERRLTAYHEAGHAIVIHSLPNCDPVHQISIVPRGQAGGMTISLPAEDRSYMSRSYMLDEITSLLGGRVAESLVLGDISTGASNDIQRASQLARKMVTVYGMSDAIGSVSFESGHDEIFIGRSMAQQKSYSEKLAAQIDDEIKKIIDGAYRRCEDILGSNMDVLRRVAEYLLEHEVMEASEFEKMFAALPEGAQ
jgi:cell division protease FtsH